MVKENDSHPIIAHGEVYVKPIIKKYTAFPKHIPHEYERAKQKILHDIDILYKEIQNNKETFLDKMVICFRMEPKFEAKSYEPTSLLKTNSNMEIVGGRRYLCFNEEGNANYAKLYFVKTDYEGIQNLQHILERGTRDKVDKWRKQIGSLHSMDLLKPEEKIMGFPEDWKKGVVEIVLHPLEERFEELMDLFYSTSNIPEENTKVRKYDDKLTFISAKCNSTELEAIKRLNPIRAVHPLGQIEITPIRFLSEKDAPKPSPSKQKSKITIGVFDGGVDETIPLLKNYVKGYDCVSSPPEEEYISHGVAVCGAVLYGNLAGKNGSDVLPPPCVSIESFRVLPLQDRKDFELYEAIDALEEVVKKRPDIKLYNISFGPAGAIVDDSINRFTYVLDRITYNVEEGDINPLFCIAAGNDGNLDYPLNRIQSPSDMVNGLGIGAYTYNHEGTKTRAFYSCIGAGREGAKVKPDILEFGGSIDRPFILVGTKHNSLATSCGTSFSSPLVAHKIGEIMARSENITPHMGRTLLVHSSEIVEHLSRDEQGYGLCTENIDDILTCGEKRLRFCILT